MIRHLKIKNFKSHRNSEIDFSNLTVLCGANGVGKSTAIQVLLLLREAFLKNTNFEYLDLKSNSITIGTAKDALYQFSENNEISFDLNTDINDLHFSFNIHRDSELVKTMIYKKENTGVVVDKVTLNKESIFNTNCQYISAARLSPQISYKKDDVVVDIHKQISVVDGQAEYVLHYLDRNRNRNVLPELCNKNSRFTDLLNQTTFWEREICEGVNVVVQDVGSLGYELKYSFDTESSHGKTNEFKATNVGFGLTYVMPVIVAILAADVDAILFIENPEAHLHPNGQAKLAELICLAAQVGIQIVIETHSDHIINGILVNCKKYEETGIGILKDNVAINYFEREEKLHSSNIKKINIEAGGRIRYTPKGFFDQFTIDRKFLMGF